LFSSTGTPDSADMMTDRGREGKTSPMPNRSPRISGANGGSPLPVSTRPYRERTPRCNGDDVIDAEYEVKDDK